MAPDAQAQATLAARTPTQPPLRSVRVTRTARADWQPAEADPPLAAGAVIDGRYRVITVIGEGGMGRVYETEHLFLRRRLALKLVRRDAGTGEAAARLLQEAVLAGKVPHATVVPVFDCAALPDGQVYVAMELLRGESLEEALLRPQPAEAALRWLAEVARGLAAAHRAGIVHRDVKPANLFLARASDGTVQPRILDFGIAKLLPGLAGEAGAAVQTQAGALLGTPFYMAPERIRGETGDARADLYAFGVILYEALTGQVPFVGEGFMEIVGRHLREAPLDPRQAAPQRRIPDPLAELALALLRKDAEARPGDGDAVAAALLAVEREAIAGLWLGADAPAAAVDGEGSTQRLEGHVVADMSAQTAVLDGPGDAAAELATRATVSAEAGLSAGTGAQARGDKMAAGTGAGASVDKMASGTGAGASGDKMSSGAGVAARSAADRGRAGDRGAERSARAGDSARENAAWSADTVAAQVSGPTTRASQDEADMSSRTGPAGLLRAAALLLAFAAGGGLIAWVLVPWFGPADPPGAAATAPEARAPAVAGDPAATTAGRTSPTATAAVPTAAATKPATSEAADPSAATTATSEAAGQSAVATTGGTTEAGTPGPAGGSSGPESAGTASGAEPEAGRAPAKKRGKKAPRKAGTTEPGPRGSGPKIKTDVYDE